MISTNTAIMHARIVVGSLLAGKLSNRYGRRKAVLINIISSILGSVINLFRLMLNSQWKVSRMIYCWIRVFHNLEFNNFYSVIEISSFNIAGKLGTVIQLQLAMGIFVSYALSLPLT